MAFDRLQKYSPYLLALLRIVAALLFIEHGTAKWMNFPPMGGPGGAPQLLSLFGIAGLIEIIGGILVLLGLFTRPAAFIMAGEMAVAYWMMHAPHSPYPLNNGGEAAILFCFVFLYLVAAGPGAFSVDGRGRRV
jgi:putative oxidoreductase